MHFAREINLKIRAGYDIAFECYQDVPTVLLLSVHPSREKDLLTPQRIELSPGFKARQGLDPSGTSGRAFSLPRDDLKSALTSSSATAACRTRSLSARGKDRA